MLIYHDLLSVLFLISKILYFSSSFSNCENYHKGHTKKFINKYILIFILNLFVCTL